MEKNKIRILFIVPSLRRAGAEIQVVDLVNSLSPRKFDTYLFSFEKQLDQYDRLDHNKIKFFNKHRKYKLDFTMVKTISNIISKEKIDIVHCTLQISLLMGWLAIMLAKRKPILIAAIHTTINKSPKEEFFDRTLFKCLLRRCSRVIFVCKNQARYWETKYPFLSKKSVVIYNGVDATHFDPVPFRGQRKELKKSLSIPDDTTVITCIAGFRKEKGHNILVEAFNKIKPDSYLLLAGDGETRKDIESLVKKRGLQKRIKFLGNIQDVRPLLAASDLSVLASTAVETFSIAMLESMSMGVPVVATNIGGLSEAITPGKTGALVSPGNPDIFGETLSKIIDNPPLLKTMGVRCRELIIKKFSKDKMVLKTENLLTKVNEGIRR